MRVDTQKIDLGFQWDADSLKKLHDRFAEVRSSQKKPSQKLKNKSEKEIKAHAKNAIKRVAKNLLHAKQIKSGHKAKQDRRLFVSFRQINTYKISFDHRRVKNAQTHKVNLGKQAIKAACEVVSELATPDFVSNLKNKVKDQINSTVT